MSESSIPPVSVNNGNVITSNISSYSTTQPSSSSSASLSSPPTTVLLLPTASMDPYSNDTVYSCRKCRTWLFRGHQINVHEVHKHSFSRHRMAKDMTSAGQTASTASSSSFSTSSSTNPDDYPNDESVSSSSSSSSSSGTNTQACTSYFLHEPLGWMKETTEDIENKLNCYKCHTRVGTLKWAGNQCSCGTWITPAIQIYKKAIDFRYVPVNSSTTASNSTPTTMTQG